MNAPRRSGPLVFVGVRITASGQTPSRKGSSAHSFDAGGDRKSQAASDIRNGRLRILAST
jgi:hypothetical protein